jgi:hypothetical protein
MTCKTKHKCSDERTGAMGDALLEEGKAGFLMLPDFSIKNRGHCSGF